MFHLIPSKDVREYMEKNGRVLTDFEKAALIYEHDMIGCEKKAEMLKELADSTQDMRLKRQIQERLAYKQECLERFYEKQEGMIYQLSVYVPEDRNDEEYGYFASGELAVTCGKKFKQIFTVSKIKLTMEEKSEEDCEVESASHVTYNKCGELVQYWNEEVLWKGEEDMYDNDRFEDAFVDLPYPFRTGDLVRILGRGVMGIVQGDRTEEEYQEWKKWLREKQIQIGCDSTDSTLIVEIPDEDGAFGHYHVPVVLLEYAEPADDDPKKEVLEAARDLVQKKGSIEYFQMMCEKMAAKGKGR